MPSAKPFLFKRPNGFWYIHYLLDGKHKKCLAEFMKEFLEYARSTYARAPYDIFRICLRYLQEITGVVLSQMSINGTSTSSRPIGSNIVLPER